MINLCTNMEFIIYFIISDWYSSYNKCLLVKIQTIVDFWKYIEN